MRFSLVILGVILTLLLAHASHAITTHITYEASYTADGDYDDVKDEVLGDTGFINFSIADTHCDGDCVLWCYDDYTTGSYVHTYAECNKFCDADEQESGLSGTDCMDSSDYGVCPSSPVTCVGDVRDVVVELDAADHDGSSYNLLWVRAYNLNASGYTINESDADGQSFYFEWSNVSDDSYVLPVKDSYDGGDSVGVYENASSDYLVQSACTTVIQYVWSGHNTTYYCFRRNVSQYYPSYTNLSSAETDCLAHCEANSSMWRVVPSPGAESFNFSIIPGASAVMVASQAYNEFSWAFSPVINLSVAGSCIDGVKDQDELFVDYGGVCGTCVDGVRNGDEVRADWGGRCGHCSGIYAEDYAFKSTPDSEKYEVVNGTVVFREAHVCGTPKKASWLSQLLIILASLLVIVGGLTILLYAGVLGFIVVTGETAIAVYLWVRRLRRALTPLKRKIYKEKKGRNG